MVPLHEVFHIGYGSKVDANKVSFQNEGVNFVSRSSKNLGIVGKVEPIDGMAPFEAQLITVTLGGSYLLSAFVQPEQFYSAQNIKVLRPKFKMSLAQKIYYCECVRANRFKYSTHGREANRSLQNIVVPSPEEVPSWVKSVELPKFALKDDHKLIGAAPEGTNSNVVRLDELFEVRNGTNVIASDRSEFRLSDGHLPFVRPSKTQITSFIEYVDSSCVETRHIYPRHTLYVSTDGQGSHTYSYVATESFIPGTNVCTLIPKRIMSLQEKVFYAAVISAHRPLFSYGRKPKGERLKSIMVPEWAPKFIYEKALVATIAV